MILHHVTFRGPVIQPTPFVLAEDQYLIMRPLGDIHYGAPGFPADRFCRDLEWWLERGAWFLGMGEYIDFTSETQRRMLRELRNSTLKQIDDLMLAHMEGLITLLKPSRGRWLGMLQGHHYWPFQNGTTADQKLCEALACKFLGTMGHVRLELGKKTHVDVIAHHGLGGGRRRGSGLLRLEDMVPSFPEGDLYLQGHNHSRVNDPLDSCYVAANGHLYHRTKILARTGSWLRGYLASEPKPLTVPAIESEGSYIEKALYQPASIGGLAFSIGTRRDEAADLWLPDIRTIV